MRWSKDYLSRSAKMERSRYLHCPSFHTLRPDLVRALFCGHLGAMDYSDDFIREVLTSTKVIALVGASANPMRPSHGVMRFLLSKGYVVHPINPGLAGQDLLGQLVYGSLTEIPKSTDVDMIDIFRRFETVLPIVEEAIAELPGLKTVWTQLAVVNDEAAALAESRGLRVVQDRCPAIEYPRLM